MSAVWRQLAAAVSVSIALLVAGTALAWPSPVIFEITKTGKPFTMTHNEIAFMVSVIYFGNIVSPLPTGFLMEAIGRKSTLTYLSIVSLSCWIITYFAKNAIFLYGARFLVGMWLGIVSTVVPLYVAEISDAKFRGAFSTLFQLMTNLGVFFAFYIGSRLDYYTFTLILGIIPVFFIISFAFMPESPYWQMKRGRHEEAIKSISWLRALKREDVKEEIEEIEASLTKSMSKKQDVLELLRDKGNRKAFIIVEVLSITQRASGISAIMAYTSTTLPEEGTALSVNDSVTVIGAVLTVAVFISTFLTDRLGRRPLLVISCFGSGLSMLMGGIWFFLDSNTFYDVSAFAWVPFASLIAYSIFFAIGLGPLATTIQGELFPTSIKGIASGVTAIVLAATSFFMNLIYVRIADHVGMYLNFLIFAFSAFVAAIFVCTSVVETKGKTLYQIQRGLSGEIKEENFPL